MGHPVCDTLMWFGAHAEHPGREKPWTRNGEVCFRVVVWKMGTVKGRMPGTPPLATSWEGREISWNSGRNETKTVTPEPKPCFAVQWVPLGGEGWGRVYLLVPGVKPAQACTEGFSH